MRHRKIIFTQCFFARVCNTRAGECRVTDMKELVWKFTNTEDANRRVDLAIWLALAYILTSSLFPDLLAPKPSQTRPVLQYKGLEQSL